MGLWVVGMDGVTFLHVSTRGVYMSYRKQSAYNWTVNSQAQHNKRIGLSCTQLLHASQLLRRTLQKNFHMKTTSNLQQAQRTKNTNDSESDGQVKDTAKMLRSTKMLRQGQAAGHHADDVQRQEDADGAGGIGASKNTNKTAATAVSPCSAMIANGIRRTSNCLDHDLRLGDAPTTSRRASS